MQNSFDYLPRLKLLFYQARCLYAKGRAKERSSKHLKGEMNRALKPSCTQADQAQQRLLWLCTNPFICNGQYNFTNYFSWKLYQTFICYLIATILLQKTKVLMICKFLERYVVFLLSDRIIKPFMIASSVVINLFCIIIKQHHSNPEKSQTFCHHQTKSG